MQSFKSTFQGMLVFLLLVTMVACGSSSSTSSSSGTTTTSTTEVTSLTEIPNVTDMVNASSGSSSLSRFAVSGTPPVLSGISTSNADTYFWGGLVASVNTNSGVTDVDSSGSTADELQEFWEGEGMCRVAQGIGYSFQEIERAGTSMCYLKNAPTASSGVSITSGDVTASELFSPPSGTTNRIVQVTVSGDTEGEGPGDQDIYIQVYGDETTEGAAGYAVDLWFCSEGESTASGYETVRYDSENDTVTQTSVHNDDFGISSFSFTGILTENADGNHVFDTAEDQSVTGTFSGTFGDSSFLFKYFVSTNVDNGTMTSKTWESGNFGGNEEIRKVYILSSILGSSTATLAFDEAGVATEWTSGGTTDDAFYSASEWVDTRYQSLTSGSFYDSVNNFDFTSDDFWSGTLAAPSTAGTADYSCSPTVDVTVTMDMSDSGFQSEVVSECESGFSEMQFCDGDAVNTAREYIWNAEFSP